MAHVGITYNVRSEIGRAIREMQNKELTALGEQPEVVVTEAEAEAAYWGPHIHLKDTIPDKWKTNERTVVLKAKGKEGEDILYTHYTFNHYIESPPKTYSTMVELPYEDPRVQRYAEHYYNCKDIRERWSGVQFTIINFLSTCKSLNEAVKLMPELAHYLPKYLIDKMAEKRGPRAKTSTAVVPDEEARNNMIASLVAARIS